MTMHLLGPAYTTTHHGKRKSKMTTSKYTKIGLAWLEDCKFCKRIGVKPHNTLYCDRLREVF